MSSTKYASAVAAVKAMESSLITQSEFEQLINAKSAAEMEAILSSGASERNSLNDVWEMLQSFAPDSEELKILLYRNDFHNLKAALKAMLSNREPEQYYITPTNLELDELKSILTSKEYDYLPEYMRETAEQAYELITRTLDGQLSDSLIDSAALSAMQKASYEFGDEFIQKYSQIITVCADIKTAYRCSVMNKPYSFIETAICGSEELDKEALARASQRGTESLFSFLETTPYNEAAEILKSSPAQFEKWCDDIITDHAESARMKSFGTEPLAAYFIAKETEIKNLRILKVCKECKTNKETIMERMRKLYV